jgi:hypothetical protein
MGDHRGGGYRISGGILYLGEVCGKETNALKKCFPPLPFQDSLNIIKYWKRKYFKLFLLLQKEARTVLSGLLLLQGEFCSSRMPLFRKLKR